MRENLLLDEVGVARSEVQSYKGAGGGAICEMSVVGIRRTNHTLSDLASISKATGVHILSATGFYYEKFLPEWALKLTVRDMTDMMMEEVVQGVGEGGIRCGLMYCGCSYPLKEVEKRTLEAAAIVHKETGELMCCTSLLPGLPLITGTVVSRYKVPFPLTR